MFRDLKTLIVVLFSFLSIACYHKLERKNAEQSVKDYLSIKHDGYLPRSFGEFFEQNDTEEIQAIIETDREIMYSLVHTYLVGENEIKDEYFHLDKDMKVLGHLSKQQMMDLVMGKLFKSDQFMHILDTMGVDTSNVQKQYEESNK